MMKKIKYIALLISLIIGFSVLAFFLNGNPVSNPNFGRILVDENRVEVPRALDIVNGYLRPYNLTLSDKVESYSALMAYVYNETGDLIVVLTYASKPISDPHNADIQVALIVNSNGVGNPYHDRYFTDANWTGSWNDGNGSFGFNTFIYGKPAQFGEHGHDGRPEDHFNTEWVNVGAIYVDRNITLYVSSVKLDIYQIYDIIMGLLVPT